MLVLTCAHKALMILGRTPHLRCPLRLALGIVLFAANCEAQLTFVPVGHTSIPGATYVNDVAIAQANAFLSCDASGLQVYNISNPAQVYFVSGTNNGSSAEGLLILSNTLFLANYSDGLRVYDISNPTNLINIGHTNNGGQAWNLAISGNYLFLANGSDGLRVYDISTPAHPTNVGHTNNVGTAYSVAAAANTYSLPTALTGCGFTM